MTSFLEHVFKRKSIALHVIGIDFDWFYVRAFFLRKVRKTGVKNFALCEQFFLNFLKAVYFVVTQQLIQPKAVASFI